MKNWTIILTCLVVVETLLIIIYLCGAMEVNSSSPSVLISAFGVIITFVVAWQIWATIDARNSIKEFEKRTKDYDADLDKKATEIKEQLKSEFDKKIAENEELLHCHISSLLQGEMRYELDLFDRPRQSLYDYLNQSINGLKYGLRHKNRDICNLHIYRILKRVRRAKEDRLTDEQIKELVGKVSKLTPLNGMDKDFERLLNKIQNFNNPPIHYNNFDEDGEIEYEDVK